MPTALRGRSRRVLAAAVLVAAALLASCATRPPTAEERAAFGAIGVRVADATPEVDFDPPVTGWAEGLGMGTVRGLCFIVVAPIVALEGAARAGVNPGEFHSGSGKDGAVVAVVFVGTVAAIGVGVATLWFPFSVAGGSATACSPDTIEAAEPVIRKIVEDREIRHALGRRFSEAVGRHLGHEPVDPSSARTILEVRLDSIERGRAYNLWTFDRPFEVVLRASARVIRRSDGRILWEGTRESTSGEVVRTYADWAVHGGAPLRAAIDGAVRRLAGELASVILSDPGGAEPRTGHVRK